VVVADGVVAQVVVAQTDLSVAAHFGYVFAEWCAASSQFLYIVAQSVVVVSDLVAELLYAGCFLSQRALDFEESHEVADDVSRSRPREGPARL